MASRHHVGTPLSGRAARMFASLAPAGQASRIKTANVQPLVGTSARSSRAVQQVSTYATVSHRHAPSGRCRQDVIWDRPLAASVAFPWPFRGWIVRAANVRPLVVTSARPSWAVRQVSAYAPSSRRHTPLGKCSKCRHTCSLDCHVGTPLSGSASRCLIVV